VVAVAAAIITAITTIIIVVGNHSIWLDVAAGVCTRAEASKAYAGIVRVPRRQLAHQERYLVVVRWS